MSIVAIVLFNLILINLGIVFCFPHHNKNFKRELQNSKSDIKETKPESNVKTSEVDDAKAESSNNPLQQLLSGGSGNGQVILGTYQALIMPMPHIQGANIPGFTNILQGFQNILQG